MMASEEAWLLGKAIRQLDPQAVLISGPVPTTGQDEVFKNPANGKQTFVIKAEKVPNAAGIKRVIETARRAVCHVAGCDRQHAGGIEAAQGRLDRRRISVRLGSEDLARDFQGFQSRSGHSAERSWRAAPMWSCPPPPGRRRTGRWENFQGKIQPFAAAIAPPDGARREGDVYYTLLGRAGLYNAAVVRQEMGERSPASRCPIARRSSRRSSLRNSDSGED